MKRFLLFLSLLMATGGVPNGFATTENPPRAHSLTVYNGTGDGDYMAGEEVDISAILPEAPSGPASARTRSIDGASGGSGGTLSGYVFLRWMVIEGGGHVQRFLSDTKFTMPDKAVKLAAVFGKIESWFPPGPEDGRKGILLPKDPEAETQTRMEQKIRVSLLIGEAEGLSAGQVWDQVVVTADWFPGSDAIGTWHSEKLVKYFDQQEQGTEISKEGTIPKSIFEESSPGTYEGSVWYEGAWTQAEAAEKVDAEDNPVRPEVSTSMKLDIHGKNFARTSTAADGSLLPVEVEVIHTEKMRDDNGVELSTTVSPGKDTLLRDEIADLRIKIPPLGTSDWDVKIDLEPTDMKTQTLGSRGSVQMYDFGKVENGNVTPLTIEANGSTKAGPYDIKLVASKGGEETFRIAINKEGKLKIRIKTTDNKVDVTSQEFTVTKRIRKYGKDTATATYDFNKHDKHFENAAASWGSFYQHPVDDVERLKAIGMTESELGRNPQNSSSRPNDIMTIGHPDDHVLDTLRYVSGHREKEVDPQNNAVRDMNYPQAAESPAGTAIHWGTCWVYHKAQTIANNPQPPPSLIPGPWRSWDDATTRYNGGGVNNYLERVTRAFREGRHPTDQNTLWPVLTNGRARN